MLSLFLCHCSLEDSFQIIREYDTVGELINLYFRCFECGKDYSLEEVKG